MTRTPLTRARVLAAAVALADRDGPEALTVRRLADDLDVHPTSLYNHVANKDAILDGVVEQLFDEVAVPVGSLDWQDWVRQLAASLRTLAQAHPGAFLVLARRPAETPAALVLTERGLDAFARGGFSPRRATQAVRAVSLAVLGAAVDEAQRPADATPADALYAAHPRLQEAAAALPEDDDGGHWDVLVDALVRGLAP